jgi:hypothetical protein
VRVQEKTSNSIPTFTEEQYKYLVKVFPVMVIQPKHTLSEIQYAAGATAVVEAVRSNIGFTRQRSLRDER